MGLNLTLSWFIDRGSCLLWNFGGASGIPHTLRIIFPGRKPAKLLLAWLSPGNCLNLACGPLLLPYPFPCLPKGIKKIPLTIVGTSGAGLVLIAVLSVLSSFWTSLAISCPPAF